MIAIIDYGMGNLRSVQKALEKVGASAAVTQDPDDLRKSAKVVLPGVGAMRPAMEKLKTLGFIPAIKDAVSSGKPFLGICLGLQLLFTESSEGGTTKGLDLLPGCVKPFTKLKVPHIGWNNIHIKGQKCEIFKGIENGAHVYFCHSYFVKPNNEDMVAATTDYGVDFVSAVCCKNILGMQFHPEKSQSIGLKILKNFAGA